MSLITNDAIMQHFGYPGAVNDKVRAFFNALYTGSGSPEGVITAATGAFYLDTTNGALYAKQSGSGNTGWIAGVAPGAGNAIIAASGDITGVTDDAAIAAAIIAGHQITLQQGATYYTAAGWTINVSNFGLDGNGATLVPVTLNSFQPIKTDSGGSRSKVSIRNLTIDGTGDNARAQVLIQDATDVFLENVKVTAGRWGIELLNVTRGTVKRCEVTGQTGAAIPVGIYFAGTSAYCRALENYVHDTGGLGIFFDSTASAQTILGHQAIGNRVVTTVDNGIRFQTAIATPLQGHYVCSGNLVIDAAINGIRVNGYNAAITGNVVAAITQGQGGIRDTGAGSTVLGRSTITGNSCISITGVYNSGGIDLHATSDGVVIGSNYCEGWSIGISLAGTGYTVSNNQCVGNGSAGIELQGVTESTVTGNRCKNNSLAGAGHGGIELNSSCVGVVISGNRCFDDQGSKTQSYGIALLTGADFCTVTGNDVRGNLTTNLLYQASTSNIRGRNNLGGDTASGTPSVGASPASFLNNANVPAIYIVTGGTVSLIEYGHNVNGSTSFFDTGRIAGDFYVDVGDRIRVTYTVAPVLKRLPFK